MAFDGAGDKERRQNLIGVGRPWMRNHFPVATPDQEWRIASGLAYGGNTITGIAPVTIVANYIPTFRPRRGR